MAFISYLREGWERDNDGVIYESRALWHIDERHCWYPQAVETLLLTQYKDNLHVGMNEQGCDVHRNTMIPRL